LLEPGVPYRDGRVAREPGPRGGRHRGVGVDAEDLVEPAPQPVEQLPDAAADVEGAPPPGRQPAQDPAVVVVVVVPGVPVVEALQGAPAGADDRVVHGPDVHGSPDGCSAIVPSSDMD